MWGHSSDDLLEFHKAHNYQDRISYIVENDLIIDAVTQKLKSLNVDVIYENKVSKYDLPTQPFDNVNIKFESGESVECKLLLGTDGARSQVRKAMGVDYLSWDYDQKGIVAAVKVSTQSPNSTAWQRFVPDGNVALLPLSHDTSSLVWATTPDKAKALVQMSEESFVDAFNSEWTRPTNVNEPIQAATKLAHNVLEFFNLSTGYKTVEPPRVLSVVGDSRAAFPLGFGHSVKYIGTGCALLGDAAHRIHPLAGQGVNLGFGDIASFVALTADSISNGYPVGECQFTCTCFQPPVFTSSIL